MTPNKGWTDQPITNFDAIYADVGFRLAFDLAPPAEYVKQVQDRLRAALAKVPAPVQ